MDSREVEWNKLLTSMLADTACRAITWRTPYRSTPVYTVRMSHPAGGLTVAVAPEEPYGLAANGDLKIISKADRGEKNGRLLVHALEAFSNEIGIEEIIIGQDANPSFWRHMGYEQVPENERERYRTLAQPGDGIDFSIDFNEHHAHLQPLRKLL